MGPKTLKKNVSSKRMSINIKKLYRNGHLDIPEDNFENRQYCPNSKAFGQKKQNKSKNNLERSERLRKRAWSTNYLERSERLRKGV